MKIAIIGTGYVGLVSGACFADFGFRVVCIDKDARKIAALKDGISPIYEPRLDALIADNASAGRLLFDTDIGDAVSEADAVFIAVGTPARRGDGYADLDFVYAAAKEIAAHLSGYTVVINKSTVPVGTGAEIEKIIAKTNKKADFDVASNPEFLREGAAIGDFMYPDRVVIGTKSPRAREMLEKIYQSLVALEIPILSTTIETAEMIKYAANAFLALKISYINQIADLCEATTANIHDVSRGIGLDKRIGAEFLHPGPGYGGSCFPKDTLAFIKIAEDAGKPISIVEEVVRYNDLRKKSMVGRINDAVGSVKNKTIAVLGLAFKANTDDMRESPALDIIGGLLDAGGRIKAYDPTAMDEAQKYLPPGIEYSKTAMDCVTDADCVVILTDWDEFRSLSLDAISKAMAGTALVDLRSIYDADEAAAAGLQYSGIGHPV